jgi:hypothetical protein
MFSYNGKYEKDIIRFSGTPFEVSYTGENIVAVAIWDNRKVVFVNVITNTITNTVDTVHGCHGTDFNMNRLAIRVLQLSTSNNMTSCLSQIVTATMFSPVYETSNGVPENRTISFSYFPFIPQENKLGVTPQLTKKTTVTFQTKDKGHFWIAGCDILPDGKLVFAERENKRLLMFSNNGKYEKDIVRFSGFMFVPNCNSYDVFSCV